MEENHTGSSNDFNRQIALGKKVETVLSILKDQKKDIKVLSNSILKNSELFLSSAEKLASAIQLHASKTSRLGRLKLLLGFGGGLLSIFGVCATILGSYYMASRTENNQRIHDVAEIVRLETIGQTQFKGKINRSASKIRKIIDIERRKCVNSHYTGNVLELNKTMITAGRDFSDLGSEINDWFPDTPAQKNARTFKNAIYGEIHLCDKKFPSDKTLMKLQYRITDVMANTINKNKAYRKRLLIHTDSIFSDPSFEKNQRKGLSDMT